MSDLYQDWEASTPAGVGAHFYEECGSTNAVAASLVQKGEPGPLWVVAGQQSAGRGSRGRQWTSKPGNLYASLLLRPTLAPKDLTVLPFIAALAVRDTFVAHGAPEGDVRCKWPNDVLIRDRKASGILIESSARSGGMLDHVIIGIGMNIAFYPEGAQFHATCLQEITGQGVAVRPVFESLSHSLFGRLTNWNTADFSSVGQDWSNVAWGLGKHCTIRTVNESIDCVPERLAIDGGIVVRLDDGSEKRLYAGDIFPVAGLE
ncbi:biotin--[acetyl-CoA-carboxylase] ligase [Kordiimonas aestuarii]|uniref:biotin--[acetyl-CoA-carboxylase] ligase n=1 Tax=Kordiimonas aestuarii TaxID=1005925 RepID=UPI0021CF6771|nr:biotin--[acetyl-CoA-carboxylase] ligase [Kordiimonas aestuarii]